MQLALPQTLGDVADAEANRETGCKVSCAVLATGGAVQLQLRVCGCTANEQPCEPFSERFTPGMAVLTGGLPATPRAESAATARRDAVRPHQQAMRAGTHVFTDGSGRGGWGFVAVAIDGWRCGGHVY